MNNIPKTIHYCWFGPNEIPQMELECIESWKRLLPEFQIKFWNENSFEISSSVNYVKQAYEAKKYAFVSDYVRMYALYNFGGVYFDTDVEVIKPIDEYLRNDFFIGFENKTMLGTGIIGSKKNNWLLKEMLDYYSIKNFIDNNNNIDTTTNVQILTGILKEYGFKQQNSTQVIKDLNFYERDIFNPKKNGENSFIVTDRTVTIHKLSGSWLTAREKKRGESLFWRKVCRPILKKTRSSISYFFGANRSKTIELKIRKLLR